MCERLDLTHILDKIKLKFYNRLYRCDSDVLQYLKIFLFIFENILISVDIKIPLKCYKFV